jgi:hypothetical protein
MAVVDGEMTVKEALELCTPVQRTNLALWSERFDIKLREFHIGHVKTYEKERLREVNLHVVNAEVDTLLRLVESAGVGDASLRKYRPLQESFLLTNEEREALPNRAQKYLEVLEREIQRLSTENERIMNMLRKLSSNRRRF